jgi:hypothetical protein
MREPAGQQVIVPLTSLSLILALAPSAAADPPEETPTITERTGTMTRIEGFVELYWDEATGHLFLEVDRSRYPQRDGASSTPYARIQNLARVRVVVDQGS